MRQLLQVRLLFVLIALLLVPAFALPFAERLRRGWARYWEPRAETEPAPDEGIVIGALPGGQSRCVVCMVPRRSDARKLSSTDEIANLERLFRAMEEIEPLEFDEFDLQPILSLPTEEYWAELEARDAHRKATKP